MAVMKNQQGKQCHNYMLLLRSNLCEVGPLVRLVGDLLDRDSGKENIAPLLIPTYTLICSSTFDVSIYDEDEHGTYSTRNAFVLAQVGRRWS